MTSLLWWRLARENLAALLGVDVGEVSVLSIESVEWPDTSLGNPQPGLLYLQAITPGYKLMLEVGDCPYTYHTDLDAQVGWSAGQSNLRPSNLHQHIRWFFQSSCRHSARP